MCKKKTYTSLTIYYDKYFCIWPILKDGQIDSKSFLDYMVYNDSIFIYDSATIKLFMDRVESIEKREFHVDTVYVGNDFIGLYVWDTPIDVNAMVFANAEDDVDTLAFGRHPQDSIVYNEKWIFKDSVLYYSLISMIWDKDKAWRERFLDHYSYYIKNNIRSPFMDESVYRDYSMDE